MKVDFMIIGAQKSGTTSLAHYLSEHPSVCFSQEKEPEFFSNELNWRDKVKAYHKLFKPKPGQLLGEASTNYSMIEDFPGTAERIHEYNPNVKLIYVTRDPVERIISHYTHRLLRSKVKNKPSIEVLNDSSYVERSRYFHQITPYLRLFGRNKILLLLFEELISEPETSLKKVAAFLEINEEYFLEIAQFKAMNRSVNRNVLSEKGFGRFLLPLKKVSRYIPKSFIQIGLGLVGNKIETRPEFPISLRAKLYDELREDISCFEKIYGSKIEWQKYMLQ